MCVGNDCDRDMIWNKETINRRKNPIGVCLDRKLIKLIKPHKKDQMQNAWYKTIYIYIAQCPDFYRHV